MFAIWKVGDLIHELGADIAGLSSVVAICEGCDATEEEVGNVVDGVWLIAGYDDEKYSHLGC